MTRRADTSAPRHRPRPRLARRQVRSRGRHARLRREWGGVGRGWRGVERSRGGGVEGWRGVEGRWREEVLAQLSTASLENPWAHGYAYHDYT